MKFDSVQIKNRFEISHFKYTFPHLTAQFIISRLHTMIFSQISTAAVLSVLLKLILIGLFSLARHPAFLSAARCPPVHSPLRHSLPFVYRFVFSPVTIPMTEPRKKTLPTEKKLFRLLTLKMFSLTTPLLSSSPFHKHGDVEMHALVGVSRYLAAPARRLCFFFQRILLSVPLPSSLSHPLHPLPLYELSFHSFISSYLQTTRHVFHLSLLMSATNLLS